MDDDFSIKDEIANFKSGYGMSYEPSYEALSDIKPNIKPNIVEPMVDIEVPKMAVKNVSEVDLFSLFSTKITLTNVYILIVSILVAAYGAFLLFNNFSESGIFSKMEIIKQTKNTSNIMKYFKNGFMVKDHRGDINKNKK